MTTVEIKNAAQSTPRNRAVVALAGAVADGEGASERRAGEAVDFAVLICYWREKFVLLCTPKDLLDGGISLFVHFNFVGSDGFQRL
ncbi:MAG: hypothetical protein QHJ82_13930 [Verrucomicrobiota bacterium]|nr:hypothetical protein [Verrucomicrobiota bacterium]